MTPEHIEASIARALKGESGLDPDVLKIHGFSTPTMRQLFNNLCHLEGIAYLEVGVFRAASFVAAFNNNPIHATGIDDFSQDFSQKNVREECLVNINKWEHTTNSVVLIEGDCFEKRLNLVLRYDIFCYDGHHDIEPTAKALPAFFDLLADRFIYIVDDWHWESVRNGTIMGFQALDGRVNVEKKWFLRGKRLQDDAMWHNGLAIFLCEKIK